MASPSPDGSAPIPGATGEPPTLESPAYPRVLRILTVVMLVDLIGLGLWSLPALLDTPWSAGSLVLFGLAALSTLLGGWWIVHSRIRLNGDELTQTWIWTKRARAQEVSQLKLVHWRALDGLMAPRLLVRRRNGAVTWFHSADASVLTAFAERVAHQALPTRDAAR